MIDLQGNDSEVMVNTREEDGKLWEDGLSRVLKISIN